MPLPTNTTTGQEFKAATEAYLIELAGEALKRHAFLRDSSISTVEDIECLQKDLSGLARILDDIRVDMVKLARYYNAGGKE